MATIKPKITQRNLIVINPKICKTIAGPESPAEPQRISGTPKKI